MAAGLPNPVPLMVTAVPPAAPPSAGVTEAILGRLTQAAPYWPVEPFQADIAPRAVTAKVSSAADTEVTVPVFVPVVVQEFLWQIRTVSPIRNGGSSYVRTIEVVPFAAAVNDVMRTARSNWLQVLSEMVEPVVSVRLLYDRVLPLVYQLGLQLPWAPLSSVELRILRMALSM